MSLTCSLVVPGGTLASTALLSPKPWRAGDLVPIQAVGGSKQSQHGLPLERDSFGIVGSGTKGWRGFARRRCRIRQAAKEYDKPGHRTLKASIIPHGWQQGRTGPVAQASAPHCRRKPSTTSPPLCGQVVLTGRSPASGASVSARALASAALRSASTLARSCGLPNVIFAAIRSEPEIRNAVRSASKSTPSIPGRVRGWPDRRNASERSAEAGQRLEACRRVRRVRPQAI